MDYQMKNKDKILLITFGVFMTEAIIHYNIGLNSKRKDKKFTIPANKDLVRLMITVGIFSYITAELTHQVVKT